MKLKNLMYATMIACAFASCSKDDETTPDNGGQANGDATLEVNLNVTSTKAIGTGTGDATLNTLTLIVFDGTGKAEAVVTSNGADNKGTGVVSVRTTVTSGEKKVTVLANAADVLTAQGFTVKTSSLDDLKGITYDFVNETATGLVMNSALSTVQLTAGTINYLGYSSVPTGGMNLNDQNGVVGVDADGVRLYRNVAKVKLNGVTMQVNGDQYPNASFAIQNVFLLHAKQSSRLFSETEWAATETGVGAMNYYNGVTGAVYEGYVKTFGDIVALTGGKAIFKYLVKDKTFATVVNGALLTNALAFSVSNATAYAPLAADVKDFYAYENSANIGTDSIYTLLVLEGNFTYGSEGNQMTNKRYYSLAVGRTGLTGNKFALSEPFLGKRGEATTASDVLRNLQYNVTLNIKGEGYVTPFGPDVDGEAGKAILDVQCKVVEWGVVDQSTEI